MAGTQQRNEKQKSDEMEKCLTFCSLMMEDSFSGATSFNSVWKLLRFMINNR